MTQEEKALLLKDLSARLPYGVMVSVKDYNKPCVVEAVYDNLDVRIEGCLCYNLAFECKPYLRSISSMTKEERKECNKLRLAGGMAINVADYTDWLNSHHFDYRGLIEKGLALEASEDMYK